MFIFQPLANFFQCHASTLAQLKDGRIFVAWFGGTKESHPDTAIWMSYLLPNQNTWCPPYIVVKINNKAHWNPVLFVFGEKMYMFFKVGSTTENWITYYMIFENEKWSEAEILVKTDVLEEQYNRGPVRSKPIVLSNGYWLAPSSDEKTINHNAPQSPNDVIWKAFADISKDEGKTWNKSEFINFNKEKYGFKNGQYGGIIQPSLWESCDGNVHMLLRSTAGYIFRSDSFNYGKTWCEAYPTEWPNNNSGIDVVKFNDHLFLVFNPVSKNWGARTPLSLSFSSDNGKKWSNPIHMEKGAGSFSYPSIISIQGEGLGITYTWNRLSISYVKIMFKNKNNVV